MNVLHRIQNSIRKRGIKGVLLKIPNRFHKEWMDNQRDERIRAQDWKLYFDAPLAQVATRFKSRNELYDYFDGYFDNILGQMLRNHREYFCCEGRGFGENAFHSMWYRIFLEHRPKNILEIGIYRGQTLTLFGLLGRLLEIEPVIHGISPLTNAGDEVSQYMNIDYACDIDSHFNFFQLKPAHILKAYSTDKAAIELIESRQWDLIYIDGSHDYEVVKSDYELCLQNIAPNGLMVLDDSSLYFEFDRSFKGHPGPSRVVKEIAMNEMEWLIGVGHNNVFRKKGP